jgi:hypothetical protein
MTAIAFVNAGADIVVDADLIKMHPDMVNNRWRGQESFRLALIEAYNEVMFELGNSGLAAAYITNTAKNIAWFNRVVAYQAMIIISRDFRAERGDRWDLLMGDYQAKYNLAMTDPTLDYDTEAESAAADDTTKTGEIRLLR